MSIIKREGSWVHFLKEASKVIYFFYKFSSLLVEL